MASSSVGQTHFLRPPSLNICMLCSPDDHCTLSLNLLERLRGEESEMVTEAEREKETERVREGGNEERRNKG